MRCGQKSICAKTTKTKTVTSRLSPIEQKRHQKAITILSRDKMTKVMRNRERFTCFQPKRK